jgi:hypothetical protein
MTTNGAGGDSATGRRPRSRALAIADTVVGVVLALLGLLMMLILLSVFVDASFVQPYDAIVKVLIVLGWFGGSALFILFATRRRLSFYWPLVGIVAMFVFFYLLAFVEGRLAS